MKKILHFFFCYTLIAASSHAALTLITRETFSGVGTLNTATPGNLGSVNTGANFYKRAVGPKVTNDTTASGLGWSADCRIVSSSGNARHSYALSGSTANAGMFSAFYYIDSVTVSAGEPCWLLDTLVANTNPLIRVGVNPSTGKFAYYRNSLWVNTDTAVTLPLRAWFEIRLQWLTSGTNCDSLSVDYRLAGSGVWTSIYTTTTSFNMGSNLTEIRGGG